MICFTRENKKRKKTKDPTNMVAVNEEEGLSAGIGDPGLWNPIRSSALVLVAQMVTKAK